MIQARIHNSIKTVLIELGAPDVAFVVERPGEFAHGDYASNAALAAAKVLEQNPKAIANDLQTRLEGKIEGVEKIKIAGAGFLNFFLTQEQIVKEVENAATNDKWGSNDLYQDQAVMVEYTDPNPFKEFHIGHLMSNAIGESIARVLEAAGAKVVRANYQGDVGLHVAKAIWGKQQKPELSWGEAYVYGSNGYENNRGEVDEINKKVYEHSSDIVDLYEEGRNSSLEKFEKLYTMLGTKFDKYFFESESWEVGRSLVEDHKGDVFEESEGAIVYKGEQDGLHTRVFLTKAGLPTYEAKDLGLLALKEESGSYDKSITVTASEQKEYFKVVLAAAKKLSEVRDIAEKTQHVTHGMMRFAEGKMASRKGNVITGESLLADLVEESKEKMGSREVGDADKVAEQVAVGAIKYAVLRQSSGKDIIFDPEKSLSLEGDSGPYVQYAHTRALSLARKAEQAEIVFQMKVEADADFVEVGNLYRLQHALIHFPEVVARAAKELEPHYVATYMLELASTFNSWYATERIIVDGKVMPDRLRLVQAVEQTLAKGLKVLGIPVPQEM